jgi:putative transposase
MKKSRFTETEIVCAVKELEGGTSALDLSRRLGVSTKTIYDWRNKYSGMGPGDLKKLKELERENTQLKKLVADLSLDRQILQDVLRKKV